MSYIANIVSATRIQPKQLFQVLADMGEQIMVVSEKFPTVRLGTMKYALRGVEINENEDGYEVRAFSMSSTADYQLFPKVVCAIQKLTDGEVYDEESEKPLKNPKKRFGLKWRREQIRSSWEVTCVLVRHSDSHIIFSGMFASFTIGRNILRSFNIDIENPTGGEDYKRLEHHLFETQWGLNDLETTSTRFALPNPNDEQEQLGISLISIKDGKVSDFDYISWAPLFGFINMDTNETVLFRFEYLNRVLIRDKFVLFDELQYIKTQDITVEDVAQMMESAKIFQEEDYFKEHLFPGQGIDDYQRTFFLFWNPAISSIKTTDITYYLQNPTLPFNWSIWDWREARKGDKFYLVRCGEDKRGIVMSGILESAPY